MFPSACGWERGLCEVGQEVFDIDERLNELPAKGDDLERLKGLVDFEMVRPALRQAVPRSDHGKGGRPPFDHVLMFKVLVLQGMHSLSDERCEVLIKDRLPFMRFLELGLADVVPDASTMGMFHEALTRVALAMTDLCHRIFGCALCGPCRTAARSGERRRASE